MQPEAIKKYPPVLVVWEDICSTEDTEYILIADSIFVDGSQVAPVTKIPKGVIREVRYLSLEQTQRDPK